MQFWTKNSQKLDLNITVLNKHIRNTTDIKLLGLTVDEMSWKCHINHILSRLSTACCAMAEETLRTIYFSCVHSIITWNNFFWGGGIYRTLILFLKFKNESFKSLISLRHRDPTRRLFKKLEILPLYLRYISLLLSVVKNRDLYTINKKFMVLVKYTKQICIFQWLIWLHFKRELIFFGINLFNNLPLNIKNLSNEIKLFKHALKIFLPLLPFYSIEEYFSYNLVLL